MTAKHAPINVAIAGFGTVGRSVARILTDGTHPLLRLTHVYNRDVERKRVDWVPSDVVWTDDFQTILTSDVDVVVELIGGLDPAAEWIEKAVQAGKSVVTANKQVIAHLGPKLISIANEARRHLRFEAAVAGGIPIIHSLQEGLAGDSLSKIWGVLNGTCNYVLTKMEFDQVSFDDALREAQELGFAEADPTADVDGFDAQAKLAILSTVGLGRQVDASSIPLQTISTIEPVDFLYARRLECTIRQIAKAELDEDRTDAIRAWVKPTLVPLASTLAHVEGSRNIVVVEGKFCGETAFSGFGAGGDPTGSAVVSDLELIARRGATAPSNDRPGISSSVIQECVTPYYARFVVTDRPGVIASLAEVFSRHGVNIDCVLQEPGWPKDELPFVIALESCGSTTADEALGEAAAFDFNVRPPLWLPILTSREPRP